MSEDLPNGWKLARIPDLITADGIFAGAVSGVLGEGVFISIPIAQPRAVGTYPDILFFIFTKR